MREIMNYILNNMRGESKEEILDYIIDFYRADRITSSEYDKLYDWLDIVYEPVCHGDKIAISNAERRRSIK